MFQMISNNHKSIHQYLGDEILKSTKQKINENILPVEIFQIYSFKIWVRERHVSFSVSVTEKRKL